MYGFSLYNRGDGLKKSLIDPSKVKDYIDKMQIEEEKKKQLANH
jgi:hypothetical protein